MSSVMVFVRNGFRIIKKYTHSAVKFGMMRLPTRLNDKSGEMFFKRFPKLAHLAIAANRKPTALSKWLNGKSVFVI